MYNLTDKLKKLIPYEPIKGDFKIRLDANESFLNAEKTVIKEAIDEIEFNRYPDPMASGVCEKFAEFYGVSPNFVTAGNGSDELISVIINAFLPKGAKVLTFAPDFSMYRFYAELAECEIHVEDKGENLQLNSEMMIKKTTEINADCILFSNPCNPTSLGMTRDEVRKIITSTKALVILDEAYMDFWSESLINEVQNYDNVILLRTCSKALGLAGIRLGFAVANEKLTFALRSAKSPYNVSSITQKIGEKALSNQKLLRRNITEIIDCTQKFYSELLNRNYDFFDKIYETKTNFVYIKTDYWKEIFEFLLDTSISIRAFEGFLRITCGNEVENNAVLNALDLFKKEAKNEDF